METEDERFLRYYDFELGYLRHSGRIFAKQNPKIASRLDLSERESLDPHTERLLESFAYLTARLHQTIDDRFPEVANALLNVLYPHLMNPMPSMSVAQFQPTKKSALTVERDFSLFTYTNDGLVCRFKTVYPVSLMPISVTEANILQTSTYENIDLKDVEWMIRLRFNLGGFPFSQVVPFSIFINGNRAISLAIYEGIFQQTRLKPFISFDGKNACELPVDALYPLGFARDETTVPPPNYTTHAYVLLQEYFHFPLKFFFFRIQNLQAIVCPKDASFFEILIPIHHPEKILGKRISLENFLLGCTPIVNLFPKTTDPFRLTRRHYQYRLVPDQRYENTTEIYSIEDVFSTKNHEEKPKKIAPYFSWQFLDKSMFWIQKRVSAKEREVPGSDMYLSFVDLKMDITLASDAIIYAKTLCTNRFLATQLLAGSELNIETSALGSKVLCLFQPNEPSYPPVDGESLWYLISQLSLNYLGFSSPYSDSLDLLKKLLFVFAGAKHHDRYYEIDHIQGLSASSCVRRLGNESWRGFVKGLRIQLSLHNPSNAGNAGFLLGSILRHYFSLHASPNTFIEMVLFDGTLKRETIKWVPITGDNILL